MTDEMSSSRRYLSYAGRHISSFKGYVSSLDSRVSSPRTPGSNASGSSLSQPERQGWRAWAGEKIKSRRKEALENMEMVNIFPGWASRRFTASSYGGDEGACGSPILSQERSPNHCMKVYVRSTWKYSYPAMPSAIVRQRTPLALSVPSFG